MNEKLNILGPHEEGPKAKALSPLKAAKLNAVATYERQWLTKMDLAPTALQEQSQKQILDLLTEVSEIKGQKIVDLGCGSGELSYKLATLGAYVDAVDVASNALKKIPEHPHLNPIQDFVPNTALKDAQYDVVIASDLIVELPKKLYRLFFSELCRLSKQSGWIICSTPLDFNTEDPLRAFLELASTELELVKIVPTYGRLWLKANQLFQFCKPLQNLSRSQKLLNFSENMTKLIFDDEGVSHVTLLAQRKPLFDFSQNQEAPVERPKKRSVWE